jgi:hypothetical protein
LRVYPFLRRIDWSAIDRAPKSRKEVRMLWTIVVVLLILWALGFAVHIGGGLIHLLLVIALIVVVVRLIQGRRVV